MKTSITKQELYDLISHITKVQGWAIDEYELKEKIEGWFNDEKC